MRRAVLVSLLLAPALARAQSEAAEPPKIGEPGPPEILVLEPGDEDDKPPLEVSQLAPAPTAQAPAPARDPGTHFLLEADLGATLTGGGGVACDAVFGWGGTPFGLPTPLYLVGGASFTSMQGGGAGYQDERSYLDLFVGLRLYVPIGSVFRFFFEGSVGAALSVSRLERASFAPLQEDGWYFAGAAGGGVQFRLLREVSFGAGVQVLLTGDDLSGVRGALGARDEIPIRLRGSATWHF